MNIVYLSPHFPENYYAFSTALSNLGVNVLGVGDAPYDVLNPALKSALKEYYKVDDMEDYDQLLRCLGFFTHKYGKIDRLDSLNEYWLDYEARLRTDFNIFGIKTDSIHEIKRKSKMKEVFRNAGIPVAEGKVIDNLKEAKRFAEKVGYPIVAKPDKGVGALNTYKIHDYDELKNFFDNPPQRDYIFEEFISGDIYSFDGLTNRDGDVVFYTAHIYQAGIMETVNDDSHIYYYSLRDLPEDLEETGLKSIKAFDARERFFHLEFFRTHSDNKLVALEINMRPPGGYTTDMFNFANDIDIYQEWANVIVHNEFRSEYNRDYHCGYIGRKFNQHYIHTHDEILHTFHQYLVHHAPISGVFSSALGHYGYLARTKDEKTMHEIISFIQKT